LTGHFSTRLAAPAEEVWRHATTLAGVNAELRPLVRMTGPRAARIEDAPLGRVAFRSVLLLGGVVPFDVHALTLVEFEEGRFLERSSSLLQRTWEHERTVVADGDGCVVTDRLRVEPRVRLAHHLTMRVVALVFRHRHRRLAKRFGAQA
jgi:ligand-binding SRPBCC domain-containing protein